MSLGAYGGDSVIYLAYYECNVCFNVNLDYAIVLFDYSINYYVDIPISDDVVFLFYYYNGYCVYIS